MFKCLTDAQNAQIELVTETYCGHLTVLSAALGAISVGMEYGWRVLKVTYSHSTLKKYEQILGLRYQDICPEFTEHSYRSVGYAAAVKHKSFWAVALGRIKIERKAFLGGL